MTFLIDAFLARIESNFLKNDVNFQNTLRVYEQKSNYPITM